MFKRAILCSVVVVGMSATVAMAQSEAGLQEYIQACASCHGLTGHGDGPLAEYMTVEVPNITQISISNNGEFPINQIIGIIDGRTDVRAHGSSMPVWGNRYMTEIAPETGEYAAELLVRGRILALATFLEAIQE